MFESDHVVTEHKRLKLRGGLTSSVADRNKDTFLCSRTASLQSLRRSRVPWRSGTGTSPAMAERAGSVAPPDRQHLAHDRRSARRIGMTQGRIALIKGESDASPSARRAGARRSQHHGRRGQAVTLSFRPETLTSRWTLYEIEQVLGNLLNNASKFSEQGSQITLAVRLHRRTWTPS